MMLRSLAQAPQFSEENLVAALDEFRERILNEWLAPFCENRGYENGEFVWSSLDKLNETDARDFIDAVDSGLVSHKAGVFRAACSRANEYLFWEGAASVSPRRLTLWLEPVITIAGLRRMQHKFGWPAEQLGAQSASYAFDFVGYQADQRTELVSCEAKPTRKAVDLLIARMHKHAATPKEGLKGCSSAEVIALKKVIALRESSSHTFWALGPDGYGHVFDVSRSPTGEVVLTQTNDSALNFESGCADGES